MLKADRLDLYLGPHLAGDVSWIGKAVSSLQLWTFLSLFHKKNGDHNLLSQRGAVGCNWNHIHLSNKECSLALTGTRQTAVTFLPVPEEPKKYNFSLGHWRPCDIFSEDKCNNITALHTPSTGPQRVAYQMWLSSTFYYLSTQLSNKTIPTCQHLVEVKGSSHFQTHPSSGGGGD